MMRPSTKNQLPIHQFHPFLKTSLKGTSLTTMVISKNHSMAPLPSQYMMALQSYRPTLRRAVTHLLLLLNTTIQQSRLQLSLIIRAIALR